MYHSKNTPSFKSNALSRDSEMFSSFNIEEFNNKKQSQFKGLVKNINENQN